MIKWNIPKYTNYCFDSLVIRTLNTFSQEPDHPDYRVSMYLFWAIFLDLVFRSWVLKNKIICLDKIHLSLTYTPKYLSTKFMKPKLSTQKGAKKLIFFGVSCTFLKIYEIDPGLISFSEPSLVVLGHVFGRFMMTNIHIIVILTFKITPRNGIFIKQW